MSAGRHRPGAALMLVLALAAACTPKPGDPPPAPIEIAAISGTVQHDGDLLRRNRELVHGEVYELPTGVRMDVVARGDFAARVLGPARFAFRRSDDGVWLDLQVGRAYVGIPAGDGGGVQAGRLQGRGGGTVLVAQGRPNGDDFICALEGQLVLSRAASSVRPALPEPPARAAAEPATAGGKARPVPAPPAPRALTATACADPAFAGDAIRVIEREQYQIRRLRDLQ